MTRSSSNGGLVALLVGVAVTCGTALGIGAFCETNYLAPRQEQQERLIELTNKALPYADQDHNGKLCKTEWKEINRVLGRPFNSEERLGEEELRMYLKVVLDPSYKPVFAEQ